MVSYWMLFTSAMNGENCVSATTRNTFDVKLPSARSTWFHSPLRLRDVAGPRADGQAEDGLVAWPE